MDLWCQCFNDYHSPLPPQARLASWLKHRQIVCIRERSGQLAAALRLRIEFGQASLWFVAVNPRWRGLGLNAAMMKWAFAQATQAGCRRCFLWIATDNNNAIRSDTNLGFMPDGRISRQYILPAIFRK